MRARRRFKFLFGSIAVLVAGNTLVSVSANADICDDVPQACQVAATLDQTIDTLEAAEENVGDFPVDEEQIISGIVDGIVVDGGCSLNVGTPIKSAKYVISGEATYTCGTTSDMGVSVRLQKKVGGVWKWNSPWGERVKLRTTSVNAKTDASCPPGTSRKYRGVGVGVALKPNGELKDSDSGVGSVAKIPCPTTEETVRDPRP